jgi:N utilization substance protein A
MSGELIAAVNQISADRGLDPAAVLSALQIAIAEAYKKEHGEGSNVKVEIDRVTGSLHLFLIKRVVKKVTDDNTEISLAEAKKMSKDSTVGDDLEIEMAIGSLGRIAAQTAKYFILNKIKDAEKAAVVEFYQTKLGDVVSGKVQSVRGQLILVELEKGVAELPEEEQIPGEFYEIGKRYRFLVSRIVNEENNRHVVLSRSSDEFLKALFRMEVPEILNDQVEIKAIARFPGQRSKVAVASNQDGLDATGACIGQRGMRIAAIMGELNEEKVDIVKWSLDIVDYIKNSLSPATVLKVEYDNKKKKATAVVPSDQLSLAIGKEGINVKLASRLTDVEIDVVEEEGKKDKEESEE